MTREVALAILHSKVKSEKLVKHLLASEACMRRLALHLGADEELWGLTGLLHDLDYDQTAREPSKHGVIAAELLKEELPEACLNAIRVHPGGQERKSRLDKALYAVDPLTGLIVASALMHPEKRLSALTADFVLRRFKEPRFAVGANRDQIASCSELGLSLEEFVGLCLEAMQGIGTTLGL
jgi:hypothetical protein